MTTAIANLQRTKRVRQISCFNGYQFEPNEENKFKNLHSNEQFSIYAPKYENGQIHNFVVNNRKTEKFLKDQNFFEEDYLKNVKEGQDHKGGFDDIGVMVVSRNYAKRRYIDHGENPVNFLKGKQLKKKLDLYERFNSVGRSRHILDNSRNWQGDSRVCITPLKKRSSSVQIKRPSSKKLMKIEKKVNFEVEPKKLVESEILESLPQISLKKKRVELKKNNRFSHSVERRMRRKRSGKRKMSFGSFQRKKLQRSETNFLQEDYLRKSNKNIRRKSGNLSGLAEFVKKPFRSKLNQENVGKLDEKLFQKLSKFPDSSKTHVMYNQRRFNTDPRDYMNKMR